MNQEEMQKQAEIQQQVAMLEKLVKQHMTPKAITRYGNVKVAHPNKAIQALAIIAQGIEKGQVNGKVTDQDFKSILIHMNTKEKKHFTITRK